jgi:hypothetical protein
LTVLNTASGGVPQISGAQSRWHDLLVILRLNAVDAALDGTISKRTDSMRTEPAADVVGPVLADTGLAD